MKNKIDGRLGFFIANVIVNLAIMAAITLWAGRHGPGPDAVESATLGEDLSCRSEPRP